MTLIPYGSFCLAGCSSFFSQGIVLSSSWIPLTKPLYPTPTTCPSLLTIQAPTWCDSKINREMLKDFIHAASYRMVLRCSMNILTCLCGSLLLRAAKQARAMKKSLSAVVGSLSDSWVLVVSAMLTSVLVDEARGGFWSQGFGSGHLIVCLSTGKAWGFKAHDGMGNIFGSKSPSENVNLHYFLYNCVTMH